MGTDRKREADGPSRSSPAKVSVPVGNWSRFYWRAGPAEATEASDHRPSFANSPAAGSQARCGDIEIERTEHRAMLAGSDLHLTRREYALLACLVERANRVVPRADLLERIWTLPDDHGSNVVDVYVRRLRRKLGDHARMLETIRGFGYCLRPALSA
jgi:DNA-binding response OmpR family regulator